MTLESFTTFLVSQMEGIRKSQIKTLAALVFGLFNSTNISIAAIGRAMKGVVKPKHNIKKVDRFLGNDRINILAMAGALLNMLVSHIPKKSKLMIAMDWTDLHDDKHKTLVLAVIACGRAIPVLWRTADKDCLKGNQTQIEIEILKDFKTIVPQNTKLIILADRGFGNIELFEQIKSLGFEYVIRLRRNFYIYCKHYNGSLEKLVVEPDTLRDMGVTLFTSKKRYPVRVITFYASGQKEPWILATNSKEDAGYIVTLYGRRMEIEECFRDLKNERNGLCLRGARHHSVNRYDRLFLVIAYGYLFMVLAGQWGEERGVHRSLMANTVKHRTLGLWRVGKYILNNCVAYPVRPEFLASRIQKVVLIA
ncbi:MAG: IS4 family transposase [Peptococcaceae bacterium]|nr:IS4 family transposase [Peptococcaceae bacterium]